MPEGTERRDTLPPALAAWRPEPFTPAPWAAGGHPQTLLGRYLRRPPQPPFRRERVTTPDGDFLDLDFPAPPEPGAPLVLLMHGLEGSARRGYAVNLYRALAERGVGAVGLNFRFCSGEPNLRARMYHSGETEDIRFVLALLAERYPGAALGAVGFSLGGNALLKYLGEEGPAAPVRAAAAVSVPYDLAAGADALDASWLGRKYAGHFVRSLVRKVEAKAALLPDSCDLERIRGARSFRTFDEHATAPVHGFAGAADYYARSSSSGFIHAIRVPTLLLHAEDDPFLPFAAFPADAAEANPVVRTAVTRRGGHVGFLEGPPWQPRFWAERQVASWLGMALGADAGSGRQQ